MFCVIDCLCVCVFVCLVVCVCLCVVVMCGFKTDYVLDWLVAC